MCCGRDLLWGHCGGCAVVWPTLRVLWAHFGAWASVCYSGRTLVDVLWKGCGLLWDHFGGCAIEWAGVLKSQVIKLKSSNPTVLRVGKRKNYKHCSTEKIIYVSFSIDLL